MTPRSRLEVPPKNLPQSTIASDRSAPSRGRSWSIASGRRKHAAPRTIGLFGLFGSGNSGNDGSLEAMLRLLRQVRPDAKVICICSGQSGASDRIARSLQVDAIPLGMPPPDSRLLRAVDRLLLSLPRRIPSLVRAIGRTRRLDALVVPGTGILDDFWEGPFNMPLTLFAWCLAARLWDTRIAFVSIGAGPVHHPISRWLMRSAVAMAQYRSYRDTVSKAFMESIGFDTRNDPVYPDIAFQLPVPPLVRRPANQDDPLTMPLTVGVGVMAYQGWRKDPTRGPAIYEAYLDKITNFVLWLLARGHPVRILMGDQSDRRAVADLMERVATARPDLPQDRLVFDPIFSLHDLMRQIAETDVVVATRYHNVVCALKLGRPTLSIGYAEKNDVLMAEMGVGRFCQHIERLDLELLLKQFIELVTDRHIYQDRIRNTGLVYQKQLEHQNAVLASRLLGSARETRIDLSSAIGLSQAGDFQGKAS